MFRCFAMLILLSITMPLQAFAAPVCSSMKIAYSENWYPLSYDTQSSKALGIALDIHRSILKKLKIQAEFLSEIPWKRQLSMVQDGAIDAIATLNYNEDRARTYILTAPIHQFKVRAFAKKGKGTTFENVSDLKNFRIAYSRGSSYGRVFNELAANSPLIQPINGTKKIIELLIADRVDFIVLPHHLGEKLIVDAGYQNAIEATGPVIFYQNVHMAISKKSQCSDIVDSYNEALKEIRQQKDISG
ncbi:transporter substrate-binding domain-containing protein [Sneathiella sp. P13V-1]|uniref:substrate-binding periplasmic protein n=1 Tax=Sneathiella sp. P13V-1 TaxID=2697366 RepID=UPI00187B6A36|nr:transporter substrate-binding domain-containing protein [Sneathiella sp. P13V-1]MBE7637903.1 transporter substrate-binding domain-containing protein [Sneathiella sp. P13V-1]